MVADDAEQEFMTKRRRETSMTRAWSWKRAMAAGVAAAAAVAAVWGAETGAAFPRPENPRPAAVVPCKAPGGYFFGPNFVRADIAVVAQGSPHLFRIERGRVKAVAVDSITVRERDGSSVTIPVAPNATVRINGRPSVLFALRRRHTVTTIRDGDSPASCVLAAAPGRG